jgi:ribosomal protein S27E
MAASPAKPIRLTCPDCSAQFRAQGRAGKAVSCPTCGNPVIVPAATRSRPEPRAVEAVSAPAPAEGKPAGIPWALAGVVLVVLALAHVGVYKLLTAESRTEMARLQNRHGAKVWDKAEKPGKAPSPGSEAYDKWLNAKELADDQRVYRSRADHTATVKLWLTLAFLGQLGLTSFAIAKTAAKQKRQASRRMRGS